MNVIAMVRKEFNVDDARTYIMGHSMGGAGAITHRPVIQSGPKPIYQFFAKHSK